MKKKIAAWLATATLLAAWATASAAPYGLIGFYQRSSSGTLSSLMFKAGVAQGCPNYGGPPPTGYKQPCYATSGGSPDMVSFLTTNGVIAAVSAAAPAWNWNGTTLTETGLFWATSAIASNPSGAPVVSDKVVNLTITPGTSTTNATSYTCIDGSLFAGVSVSDCENVNYNTNLANDSSTEYNHLGNPKCAILTIGGDDFSLLDGSDGIPGTPDPRGLTAQTAGQAGAGCSQTSGAFDLWHVIEDDATYLILANVAVISNSGAGGDGCYLFGSGPTSACAADSTLAGASYLVLGPDSDGDGVADIVDNCKSVANGDQRDTDGDGYGNICDADLNNDGTVNSADYLKLKARIGTTDPDADLNGDGTVNSADYLKLKARIGQPPGPSGLHP